MEAHNLLVTLVVALLAALIGAAIAARLGQSVILGYVVAGIAIGPFTPGFLGELGSVQGLADVGVIFLMFAIGLQITLPELRRAGKIATLGGVMLYGASVVAFASSPWFPLSVALMVIVGSFHVSSHALVQTVVQTYSLPEFRGRAVGIFQQGHVFMTVGAMLLGGLAAVWGAQLAIGSMAAAGALATFGIFLTMPSARRIR